MKHLIPDRKQAEFDADCLLNGDLDAAVDDPEYADPHIEEIPTHPEDGEEDTSTLRLTVGGGYIVADVPPCDGMVNWDYANAIKRAGVHIHALLQENARLEATVGRDVFEDKQRLLVTLREVREILQTTNYHAAQALMLESENVTGLQLLLGKIDVVLAATDRQPKEG